MVILAHMIITIVITALARVRTNGKEVIFYFCISFFFPIGGYIIAFLFYLTKDTKVKDVEEDEERKNLLLFTEREEKHKANGVISLEESLFINSKKIKRRQIIDKLKEEPLDYIDILKLALKDDDIETSHYASSALSEVKRKLEMEIQKYKIKYVKEECNLEFLREFKDILKKYISSGLMDKYNERIYKELYIEVLNKILDDKPSEEIYGEVVEGYFSKNELDKVRIYCDEFLLKYDSEEAYIKYLKYFYSIKDKKGFKEIFDKLMNSSIVLSRKGLETIRFWMEVME